jgi:Icc protein
MGHSFTSHDLRIVQITDCHLYGDPSKDLAGVNTLESFRQVLEKAMPQGSMPPDAVIATGDLVHDGSEAGYRHLGKALACCSDHNVALPGNHDDPALMKRVLQDYGIQVCGTLALGDWLLIMLDSHQQGREGGRLSRDQLTQLDQALEQAPGPVLLFVHHHPLEIGSPWLDNIGLANGEELLSRIRRHPQIRGVVWGHVHQSWEGHLNQAMLLATPSTCFQFAPRKKEFALSAQPPGWRELTLHADGTLSSRVFHLQEAPAGLATESPGYD